MSKSTRLTRSASRRGITSLDQAHRDLRRPRPRSSHCAWCFEVITTWTSDKLSGCSSKPMTTRATVGTSFDHWQQAEWMLFKADDQEVDDQVGEAGEELRG